MTRSWIQLPFRCGEADEVAAAAAARTAQVAAQLAARGMSVRDIAVLLGISPQLVSQLAAKAS